jgi:ribosomal protein S14
MSTITIQQLQNIPSLENDRLLNSVVSAYTQVRRSCSGCGRKKGAMTTITLLKTLLSRRRREIIDHLGLPADTKLSVSRQDKDILVTVA